MADMRVPTNADVRHRHSKSVAIFKLQTEERCAHVDIAGVPSMAAAYRSPWAGGTMVRNSQSRLF